ncbi:hypothetical protein C0J52_14648 [Blattella germanica]|nr:hypothetical protein C0J52_14648 [Blattella germanica]
MNLERKIETSVLNTLPQSTKSVDSDIVRFEEEENSKHTNLLPENKSENFQEINNSEQSSKTVNLQTNRNLETSEKNTNVVVPKTDETDNINLTSNSEDLQEVPSENMQQGIDTPENTITNNEEKLQHAENQLLSKRKEVIENLTHMNSLLQQIEVEIALEEECVLELHQMNLAVLRLEEKIAQQRKLLSDMRSTMSEAHKQVIKGRSECIHLSKTCLSLGIGLKGKQYKVPVGEADLMNNKLQQVAAQTKRLSKKKDQEETPPENVISMLSQPQTPVQNTTITGCECDKPKLSPDVFSDTIDCSSSTKSNSLNNKLIVTTSDNSTVHSDSTKSDNSTDQSNLIISNSSCELAKDKCEKKCEETPKSVDSESSKQIDPVVVPCLNTSTSSEDFVPVASAEASEFHLESVKRISTGELEESPDYDDVAIGLNDELQVALPQQLVEYVEVLHLDKPVLSIKSTGLTDRTSKSYFMLEFFKTFIPTMINILSSSLKFNSFFLKHCYLIIFENKCVLSNIFLYSTCHVSHGKDVQVVWNKRHLLIVQSYGIIILFTLDYQS